MEYSIPTEVMHQVDNFYRGTDHVMTDNMIASLACSGVGSTRESSLPDPIDYLKEIMKQRGLRNCDMKAYIGSSGNVSSVLKKRKPLSLRMIRNLHKYLGIPAEILIQPYKCR